MKKLISLVLVFVLVFSFSVSAFASSHTSELDALNSIDNWTESVWQILTNKIAADVDLMVDDLDLIATRNYTMLSYLLDISDFTRSTYQEIEAFSDSFFNEVSWGEPFAEVVQDSLNDINFYSESIAFHMADIPGTLNNINAALLTIHGLGSQGWEDYEDSWFLAVYNDIHQLKEVLASNEDVSIRNNQNGNFSSAISTIFSGNSSSSSVGGFDIASVVGFSSLFASNFSLPEIEEKNATSYVQTSSRYYQILLSDSGLTDWFSVSTKDSLVTVPMTYSKSKDNSNVVVTHYYQDNKDFLSSLLGGDFLD